MDRVRIPTRHVPNPRAARGAPCGPRRAEVIDRIGVDAARVETAAVAGLVAAALDSGLREAIGLGDASRVIAIGSEGATDPETFERMVGRLWEEDRG